MASQERETGKIKPDERHRAASGTAIYTEAEGLYDPPYGDVTELNTCRLIMDAVETDTLREIAEDAIDLLGSSVAVFEKNGDYAFGMFSSGWCRLMDAASRELCRTDDNREALRCGRWLCHESCWRDSAKAAIETGSATDIQCIGGINLYAEPIYANGHVVGVINIGYGTPPKEKERLSALSERFDVELEKLIKAAQEYKPRSDVMIGLAKKRLRTSAKLIGEIVEKTGAKNELQKSRAMFQAAMDNSHAGIAIAEAPTGKLLYVNDSALGIRGETKEKVVNGVGVDQYVSSWQILHFDGTPYRKEEVPLARAILNGETCTEEFIVRRADQEDRIVWANAAPIKNEHGEIIYGIVVFLDITERKKAEQENLINRIRMDIIHKIATMPEATEKDICDHVLEKMLDLSGSDIGFIGYVSPDEQEMTIHNWSRKAMAECAVHEKPVTFKLARAGIWGEPVRSRRPLILNDYNEFHPAKTGYPQGHVAISRFMAVPVFDGDRIVAVAAVGNKPAPYRETDAQQLMLLMEGWWDQIQKRRFLQEKQKMQAQINQAQKMESVGSLAGGIAHDFNNILFPIIGLSEMLMEDFPEDSPEYRNAKEILTAGKRGSDLVNQILAFSRQSEGSLIPVQFQSVLKEVLKLCRSTIPKDIELHQEIQNDCGFIMANPTQLHQIAMNLITNAYHAVEPDHGDISVRLSEARFGRGDTPAVSLESGRYAMLTVSDTGSGIDPSVIDKIFDPYFTTKKKGKGTGLGLSVVHGIVKEYGGDIRVYSEPGQGTTVTVYIPLLEKEVRAGAEEVVQNNPTGNERILLVDDEAPIAKMEKTMLERLGYQVSSRTGSVEALESFRAAPDSFDLVITDLAMPNMSGDRLAKEMMAVREDIPIIICTGFSERINRKKAEAIGIKGFLKKPVIKSEMAQMVRTVLDEAKPPV